MIPIRNIYYMLSYAFQVLNEQGYKDVATESFENVAELCTAILSRGIEQQLKRGLGREYIPITEPLTSLRGKINITESVKTRALLKRQLICSYDEFSVNSYLNRIIKTTARLLLYAANVSNLRKKELKRLMVFFADVEELDYRSINWHVPYNQNNQTYQMLISICYLIIKGLLQTNSDGTTKLMDFLDEQRMCRLYEKFILEYYRKEYSCLHATPEQIPWQLDDGIGDFLPIMQTDITLSYQNKFLIIDTKYYEDIMQSRYDVHTLHSGNLYQIFTYVKNKESKLKGLPHEVSGMLLYARTDETDFLSKTYHMSGNRISARSLDLNRPFQDIETQLQDIVLEHFGTGAMLSGILAGNQLLRM